MPARLPLVGLLALGLLLRVLVVIPPEIDGDEASVGIGALGVLRGVFPPFFYGQPFMGGLESFLVAPLVLAFGAARWTLKILPVVAGVVFIHLTYRLAQRLFDGTSRPWPKTPLMSSGWRASAGDAPEGASLALDGDRDTAWKPAAEAGASGRWLAVDLGAPTVIGAVEVDLGGASARVSRGACARGIRRRSALAAACVDA